MEDKLQYDGTTRYFRDNINFLKNKSLSDIINNFYMINLIGLNEIPGLYKLHVFFIRPDLVLFDGANLTSEIKKIPDMIGLIRTKEELALARCLDYNSPNPFIPIMTARLRSFPITNEATRSIERNPTIFGNTMVYPRFSFDHKKSGTKSVEFADDNWRSINFLMTLWIKYIKHSTSLGRITNDTELENLYKGNKLEKYMSERIFDSVGGIIYVVTKNNDEDIVYWNKDYGIFPEENIEDVYSSGSQNSRNDSFSISFRYSSSRDPYDVRTLEDLNKLSRQLTSSRKYTRNFTPNQTFIAPYVLKDTKTGRFKLKRIY